MYYIFKSTFVWFFFGWRRLLLFWFYLRSQRCVPGCLKTYRQHGDFYQIPLFSGIHCKGQNMPPAKRCGEVLPGQKMPMATFSQPYITIYVYEKDYSQTRLIRTLLICHFRLICQGNLKFLKALSLTPVLNYPLNSSPGLVHRKISAYFSNELSGSNCIWYLNCVLDN